MPRDRVWRWRPSELRPLRDSGHPLQTAEYRKAVPEAEDREKSFSSSFQTVAAVLTAASHQFASHQLRFRAIALTLRAGLRFADHRDCAAMLASNTSKINSEPSRLVIKRSSFNAQNLCGLLLIAAGLLQDLDDVFPFHRIQRRLSARERPRPRSASPIGRSIK